MAEEIFFRVALPAENGDGVHKQTFNTLMKQNTDETSKFIFVDVEDTVAGLKKLESEEVDILAASAKWFYDSDKQHLQVSVVLPRREPTWVLASDDKLEYLPRNALIVVDNELLKRQMKRARPDLELIMSSDVDVQDTFNFVNTLEQKRNNGEIDGYVIPRSLWEVAGFRTRRHTLGLQRDAPQRSRFIPPPLHGFSLLLTRPEFSNDLVAELHDASAELSMKCEIEIRKRISENLHPMIGVFAEQRRVGSILKEAKANENTVISDSLVFPSGKLKQIGSRVEMILELISIDGMRTIAVERITMAEHYYEGVVNLIKEWDQLLLLTTQHQIEEDITNTGKSAFFDLGITE